MLVLQRCENLTISNATPTINLVDTNNNSDYLIKNGNGEFNIQHTTNSVNRLVISAGGVVTIPGNTNFSANIDADGTANLDIVDVDEFANFVDDVTLVSAGGSTITFDKDNHVVTIQDNIRLNIGNISDLSIYHNGIDSYIQEQELQFNLLLKQVVLLRLKKFDANIAVFTADSGVELYDGNNIRITTTDDGVDIGGTGSIRVPNGTTGERNSSLDFRW